MYGIKKFWKKFAADMPRLYLYTSWILIGLIGAVLQIGLELTVSFILIVGYFFNILWMMRQNK